MDICVGERGYASRSREYLPYNVHKALVPRSPTMKTFISSSTLRHKVVGIIWPANILSAVASVNFVVRTVAEQALCVSPERSGLTNNFSNETRLLRPPYNLTSFHETLSCFEAREARDTSQPAFNRAVIPVINGVVSFGSLNH